MVTVSYLVCYDSLFPKYNRCYHKIWQLFYCKVQKKYVRFLLQNATFITNCVSAVLNMGNYCKFVSVILVKLFREYFFHTHSPTNMQTQWEYINKCKTRSVNLNIYFVFLNIFILHRFLIPPRFDTAKVSACSKIQTTNWCNKNLKWFFLVYLIYTLFKRVTI